MVYIVRYRDKVCRVEKNQNEFFVENLYRIRTKPFTTEISSSSSTFDLNGEKQMVYGHADGNHQWDFFFFVDDDDSGWVTRVDFDHCTMEKKSFFFWICGTPVVFFHVFLI